MNMYGELLQILFNIQIIKDHLFNKYFLHKNLIYYLLDKQKFIKFLKILKIN